MSRAQQLGRRAVRQIQRLVPQASRGGVVLAYHLVAGDTDSPVDLPLEVYQQQLRALASSSTDVVALPDYLSEPSPDSLKVVLTFDDAFANFAARALPVLEELSLPATLYVPAGFVEGECSCPLSGVELPALSWPTLRDLAAHPLVHLGSHSYSHRDVRTMAPLERLEDLRKARETLEDKLGVEILDFCYPQAKWSATAESEVKAVYRSAAIAGGLVNTRLDPYRLARKPVRRDGSGAFLQWVRAQVVLEEKASDLARRYLR